MSRVHDIPVAPESYWHDSSYEIFPAYKTPACRTPLAYETLPAGQTLLACETPPNCKTSSAGETPQHCDVCKEWYIYRE